MNLRGILIPIIILTIIVGAVAYFNPHTTGSPKTSNQTSDNFNFTLQDKKLVSGPSMMAITEGDNVVISVTADKDWPELHIHGYELHAPIKANIPTTISFTADKTGSYLVEVHFSDTNDADSLTLGTMQVYPK